MSDVPEDLDRLNELLGAIPLEREGMTIGELDGCVAGLIGCPGPVLPAGWLPTVWGGENGVAELDEADKVAAAVLDRYNRVAHQGRPPTNARSFIFDTVCLLPYALCLAQ